MIYIYIYIYIYSSLASFQYPRSSIFFFVNLCVVSGNNHFTIFKGYKLRSIFACNIMWEFGQKSLS